MMEGNCWGVADDVGVVIAGKVAAAAAAVAAAAVFETLLVGEAVYAESKDAVVAAEWVFLVVHRTPSDPAPAAGCCHDVVVDEGLIEAVDLTNVLVPGRG